MLIAMELLVVSRYREIQSGDELPFPVLKLEVLRG